VTFRCREDDQKRWGPAMTAHGSLDPVNKNKILILILIRNVEGENASVAVTN
jgi:hypothetical protein